VSSTTKATPNAASPSGDFSTFGVIWIKCLKAFRAKRKLIHEMYLAPTRKAALAAYDQFISSYQIKFPKACQCLEKDKEMLFSFYDFPAQH
jgi:hypothetical protein